MEEGQEELPGVGLELETDTFNTRVHRHACTRKCKDTHTCVCRHGICPLPGGARQQEPRGSTQHSHQILISESHHLLKENSHSLEDSSC